MSESKHAPRLRELGFREMPSLLGLTNEEKATRPPSFTTSESFTFATDESGQSWMAFGTFELSELGFNNLSHQMQEYMDAMGKRKN